MTQRILYLFAHPALEKSRINKRLLETASACDGLTVHDLYEAYPDYHIDVAREQALLKDHDIVLLQHPLYWYSVPPLVKQWFDLVLEHGWAYGTGGTHLHGKRAVSSFTTGAPEFAYEEGGFNRYTLSQFMAPVERTWALCGMQTSLPFAIQGLHRMELPDIEKQVKDYRRFLQALGEDRIDWKVSKDWTCLNEKMDQLIKATVTDAG
jgi:glutathione-regulated potassium-efflux system ancillary protein KefG